MGDPLDGMAEAYFYYSNSQSKRRLQVFKKITDRIAVEASDDFGKCWLWQGPCSGSGRGGQYGRMCLDGATVSVHRAMWTVFNGPIPPKKQIDHTCSNRRCCNPAHLEMVTHKQNQKRRDERGAA